MAHIEISAFTKEQPQWDIFLRRDLGIRFYNSIANYTQYLWLHTPVHIRIPTAPTQYRPKNSPLPNLLCANEEWAGIIQRNPSIQQPEFEPMWALLHHAQGQPLYQTDIFSINPDEQTQTSMKQLAAYLASKYDGIAWGDKQIKPKMDTLLDKLANDSAVVRKS